MYYFDRKDDYHFTRWARAVKQRDHHMCQVCGRRGVYLNSHHIKSWNSCPEERYDMDNGVTLCDPCHKMFHDRYGFGDNTEEQFEEFCQISEMLIKAVKKKIRVEGVRDEVISKLMETCPDGQETAEISVRSSTGSED